MTGEQIRVYTREYIDDLRVVAPLSPEHRRHLWQFAAYLITREAIGHPHHAMGPVPPVLQAPPKNPLYTQDYPNGNE